MRLADVRALVASITDDTVVEGDPRGVIHALTDDEQIGELVCWTWVIDPTGSHTLMIDHSHFGSWRPPGGRAHPGEAPVDAALRELREETGVEATLLRPEPVFMDTVRTVDPAGRPVHTFGVAYLCVASPDEPVRGEPDQAARWWPIDAPPERLAEHHWRRFTRAIARG